METTPEVESGSPASIPSFAELVYLVCQLAHAASPAPGMDGMLQLVRDRADRYVNELSSTQTPAEAGKVQE